MVSLYNQYKTSSIQNGFGKSRRLTANLSNDCTSIKSLPDDNSAYMPFILFSLPHRQKLGLTSNIWSQGKTMKITSIDCWMHQSSRCVVHCVSWSNASRLSFFFLTVKLFTAPTTNPLNSDLYTWFIKWMDMPICRPDVACGISTHFWVCEMLWRNSLPKICTRHRRLARRELLFLPEV